MNCLLKIIFNLIALSLLLFANPLENMGSEIRKLPLFLIFNIDQKKSVVFINKKENTFLSHIQYKTLYKLEKTADKWLANVQKPKGKWGYIDETGKWCIPPTFDEAKSFSEDNISRVKINNKWGFLNTDGSYLVKPNYYYVTPFSKGFAAVQEKKGGDYYYINRQAEKVFDQNFSSAQRFSKNGFAGIALSKSVPVYEVTVDKVIKKETVKGKELWGYIDTTGKIVIHPIYKYVRPFNTFNIARVRDSANNSKLIDTKGKLIIDKSYEFLWDFSSSGLAWSESLANPKFVGYIDTSGKEVWEASYHDFSGEHNGILINHRKGYQAYNPFGKLLIKEKSKWASNFYDANATLALRDGKWGILRRDGNFIHFPEDIIAPLTTPANWVQGFTDGIVPMINKNREIIFFDRKAGIQYKFISNSKGRLTLYDKNDKTIWESSIDDKKAYAFLARGVDELFADKHDYGEGIYDTIDKLLHQEPRKYFIPNLIYTSRSSDPYTLDQDTNEIKFGAIKMIAQGYVSEDEWGTYGFLSSRESNVFAQFKIYLETLISKKYGNPSDLKYSSNTSWKIGNKILTLKQEEDFGDGDFYNQLIMEVNSDK